MKREDFDKLTEKIGKIAEISHLNFLLGAGVSCPFIPTLPSIEKEMDKAEQENNDSKILELEKKFFSKVIKKSYDVMNNKISEKEKKNLDNTINNYKSFFEESINFLLKRKNPLLSKQINIFTTNIDIFIEKTLEDLGLFYNDGFTGHLYPVFNTSYFQTIIKKKSEYYEQQSEIPVFNLYKLHGSLTWEMNGEKIVYSDLSIIRDIKESFENDEKFKVNYDKLLIINPNRKKLQISVLENVYYELLRIYSLELEKENSLLVVSGFSFNDQHILDVTKRAMNSNPTLSVCIFCYKSKEEYNYKSKFKNIKYTNNLYIIKDDKEKIDLKWITKNFISKLSYGY